MSVRQAGAPATNQELEAAAKDGVRKRLEDEYAYQKAPDFKLIDRCQCRLHPRLAFFFDGTGNNMYEELRKPEEEQALSNVAKLYMAAIIDRNGAGATPTYIPGVGTPFRVSTRLHGFGDFPDDPGGPAGLGLGTGGEMRIRYALMEFARILSIDWNGSARHMEWIDLSVFGFSRGATEARAFVRRLIETQCDSTGDGLVWIAPYGERVPLRITFMGLFDTVASVGGPGLHLDWGKELAIPPQVQRCVHFVSAHEVRQAFPLDSVRVGRSYPGNCEEVVYPGVHSDVGGGYYPGHQGRSNQLARIPLRHMYAEALRAGVMLNPPGRLGLNEKEFSLPQDDPLTNLFQDYQSALNNDGNDVESLIHAHRQLKFYWRGWITRNGQEERVLGQLALRVDPAMCDAVPPATAFSHPRCPPRTWNYKLSPDPATQAKQLLAEHRRLVQRIAFLRNPVDERQPKNDWPPALRPRTAYENLILSAWDTQTAPQAAVDTLLAEYVHDSVAHFTQWPCALHEPRGVYSDSEKYYASNGREEFGTIAAA
jgi:hypothetical protein